MHWSPENICVCASASKFIGEDVIDRQQKTHSTLGRCFHCLARHVQLVGFQQRFADVLPFGFQECVRHAAADQQGIDFVEQVLDDLNLVGNLGAAENGDKRLVGVTVSALPR